jgi:hypothetical protein
MHQEHGDDMVALPTTMLVMVLFAAEARQGAESRRAGEEAASRSNRKPGQRHCRIERRCGLLRWIKNWGRLAPHLWPAAHLWQTAIPWACPLSLDQ